MLYAVGDFFQPVAVFCCQCFYCLLHGNCVGVGGIGGKKDAIGRAGHKGYKLMTIIILSATLIPAAMAATRLCRPTRKCRTAERTATAVLQVLLAAFWIASCT